jgi:predicted nucleic acid-binding protein
LNIYADSSFLVSGYIQDAHSPEAARRIALKPKMWLTPLNRSELANAISRYVFRGQLTAPEAQQYWGEFQLDCANGVWAIASFPERAWETSIDLARRLGPTLGVRTLDSLHVACALELRPDRFWTFDDRQARLAEAAGLDTTG